MSRLSVLAEGRDDYHFVRSLLHARSGASHGKFAMHIDDRTLTADIVFTVTKDDGGGLGKEQLLELAPIWAKTRALDSQALAIILDADTDPSATWASLRDKLKTSGYSLPAQPDPHGTLVAPGNHLPLLGIWMWPDNVSTGDLETFAAKLVPPDDPLWPRADQCVDALKRDFSNLPFGDKESKAKIHTWLSWQKNPGQPLGQALTAKALEATTPSADLFAQWFDAVYQAGSTKP